MKQGKAVLCGLLAVLMLVPSVLAAPPAPSAMPDLQGHWAQAGVEKAVQDGWVNGYPDGTFRPNATITRAEFVKLILNAINLTPDSSYATWLKRSCVTVKKPNWQCTLLPYQPAQFRDMDTNWLTTQGWLDTALAFGMVVPSDYNNTMFRPSKPITRYEISVMVDRAMGKVYAATQPLKEELSFSDADQIPEWVRGYIHEAVQAGVITGYPDGTFGHSKPATRAEAVIMVQRMLDYTREGIQSNMTTVLRFYPPYASYIDVPGQITTQRVRMQVVDDVLYVSLLDILNLQDKMMSDGLAIHWEPVWQQLIVDMSWLSQYRAGINGYGYYNFYKEVLPADPDQNPGREPSKPTRMLDGQIMIPILDSDPACVFWSNGSWDKETNTVILDVSNPGEHSS